LFDKFARSTTVVDGVDLLSELHIYAAKGHLKPSTLFVTFDIADLYTMLPQEESLRILSEFLREHQCEKVNRMSIDTIVQLVRIVLEENAFVYNNRFYRQIIGGAMGSAFTLTLANIFMWKWEKQAILSKLPSTELYRRSISTLSYLSRKTCYFFSFHNRYIDDIFFTSNESEDEVEKLLEVANQFHPNIKITWKIGKAVSFLDLLVSNTTGALSSSVYHKSAAEPTVLPFISDHPRHVFQNIVQTALIRAIRYSSTFELFNIERRRIHLMLLYNG
jgi:hypothetical protein